jgi:long-subunit fatty acid transport protein
MNFKYISVLILLLLMIVSMPVQAKMDKLGQTGFKFLDVGLSARAQAMAGTYTMLGNDVNAIFYNPAGLSQMESNFQFAVHRVSWIADITYNAVAVAYNMNKIGVLGVHFVAVDYGQIHGTVVADNLQGFESTGDIDVGSWYAGLSYSRQISDKFHIGGSVKYAYENLGETNVALLGEPDKMEKNDMGDVAFDFGTIYYPGIKSLRLGINIRNFSRELKYQQIGFQMPLTFKIGFALDVMDFMGGMQEIHTLNITFDAIHPRDFSERINIGAEYWLKNIIALRAGYRFNHDIEKLSAGVGFNQKMGNIGISLDYSYSNLEFFDSINRVTFGISF